MSHNLLQFIHLATNNLIILKCDVKSFLHSGGQATVTILKRDHMQNPHHGEMKKYVGRPQLDSCKAVGQSREERQRRVKGPLNSNSRLEAQCCVIK